MPAEIRLDLGPAMRRARANFSATMTAGNFRFAIAKSMSDLAYRSQAEVRRDLPKTFTVRRKWISQGIRVKAATKSGLWAAIYSLDSGGRRPFMTRQEFGGIKSPESGTHIAVPRKEVFPNKTALIQQIMKPKALLGNLVQMQNAKPGVESFRQSGVRRENKRGRVWVSTSSVFKTLKVTGKRAGTEWILIKKGNKYVPAWLLIDKTKIKKTQFLLIPTVRVVNRETSATIIRNLYEAIKPKVRK